MIIGRSLMPLNSSRTMGSVRRRDDNSRGKVQNVLRDSLARRESATPFDATRLTEVTLNHRGDRCTFEAILEDYHLADPALHRLGRIVRAADVKSQESIAPEGVGLRAIAQGFAAQGLSDDERLRRQFPMYDALYAYAQKQTG